MTSFHSDVEPVFKYSTVKSHLSSSTRVDLMKTLGKSAILILKFFFFAFFVQCNTRHNAVSITKTDDKTKADIPHRRRSAS